MEANQVVVKMGGLPQLEALKPGTNPANFTEWFAKVSQIIRQLNLDELAHPAFNVVAENGSQKGRLSQWRALMRDGKVKKEEEGRDEEEYLNGKDGNKYEPNRLAAYLDSVDMGRGLGGQSGVSKELPFFYDPAKHPREVESQELQVKRWQLWRILTVALPHHQHIVGMGVYGDIHGLLMRVGSVTGGRDERRIKQDVRDLVRLTTGGHKIQWEKFSLDVINLWTSMSQIGTRWPEFILGEGLFTTFVLEAVQQDSAFKTTVELLRRDADADDTFVRYHQLMSACAATANTQRGGASTPIAVNVVGVGGRGKEGACWNWGEKGVCRFGAKCKFTHKEADKGATPRRGKCPKCGGAHGLQACPQADQSTLQAQLVEAQEELKRYKEAAHPPVKDDPTMPVPADPEPTAEMVELVCKEVRGMWGDRA